MSVYTGHCHCGNIKIRFESKSAPAQLPLRACQCAFCRSHGAISTSDPEGRVSIAAAEPADMHRYRFGFGITDFLVCRCCGVYLMAVAEIEGARYAVINVNSLACREQMTAVPAPMEHDGETVAQRRARRKAHWTPVVGNMDAF